MDDETPLIVLPYLLIPKCRDVPMGVVGASRPPILSNLQGSLSNVSHAASKGVGHSIFCDFFLIAIVGQLAKTPPPQQKVSRHITA